MSSPGRPDAPDPASGAVRYHCRHVTRYHYTDMVANGQMLAHLSPRPHPRQQAGYQRLEIEPMPQIRRERLDWFGNPATYAEIRDPHRELVVTATLEISVAPPPPLTPAATPRWDQIVYEARALPDVAEYLYASPRVPNRLAEVQRFALLSFPAGQPVLVAALDLMRRIHREFEFDPAATTVSTPVQEVLRIRRGVCQDFAHLLIACLRSLDLPARYVSGYLRTLPPPGMPKLQGSDASHAWAQVWCGPFTGWVDLDPTNGKTADQDYITLAWGRDYDDVCPLRGVILGGGEQTIKVGVDVEEILP